MQCGLGFMPVFIEHVYSYILIDDILGSFLEVCSGTSCQRKNLHVPQVFTKWYDWPDGEQLAQQLWMFITQIYMTFLLEQYKA